MGASLAKQCFSGDEPCALFRSQQQLANSAVQHGHEVRRGHSADGQGDGLPPALKLYVDTSGAHMQGIGDAKRVRTGSSGRSSRRRRERTWRSDEDESDRARRHESPMSTTSRSGSSQLSDDSFYDAELGSLSAEEEPVNRLSRVSNGSESAQASPSTDFRRLLPQEYELEEVIGAGTTSKCYRCRRTTDARLFACKIIDKRRLAIDPVRRAEVTLQLRREVEVLKRLDHPHIAKLEDAFENETHIILVMELLEGGELFDAIIERGHLSEHEAHHVVRSVLSAVQYMHDQGVVHRDIKPENLLLTGARGALEVKIIDFGFSKLLGDGITTSSFLGTSGYLAPEILLHHPYTSAVDMWACGVLLYLLLSGRLPFAPSTQLLPHQKVSSLYNLTFPDKYWRGVSNPAKNLVKKLLVLNPKHRYTAKDALEHVWLR